MDGAPITREGVTEWDNPVPSGQGERLTIVRKAQLGGHQSARVLTPPLCLTARLQDPGGVTAIRVCASGLG
jgi:hypothetical protein